MVEAIVTSHKTKLFWNLTMDVGPGQPNRRDDVEFVRLGYFLMKDNPKAIVGPFVALKPVLENVAPNGDFNDDLAEAIRVHQSIRGGVQDGKVSVAKANDFNRGNYDGKHVWMVFPLNNSMIDMASDIYPRMDLHAQCGQSLGESIRKICLHDV